MDWFLVKSVNPEYPLRCRKCPEKCNFFPDGPQHPLKCVAAPKKWYHHVAQLSAHLKPPQASSTTDHSFIKKTLIFWRPRILAKVLKWPWSHQKLTYIKSDHKMSYEMCQAVLSPNLTKKFQWEVSQITHNRFPCMMLLGGLSVNLNHLKRPNQLLRWL